MAIFHCSIKIIGRSKGQSSVASSSYRAGEKMLDQETGIVHDYTRKQGIVYSEVLLPSFAPKEYKNREILWNAVQKIETNRNAQLAREIEVALPRELSRMEQIEAVQSYVKGNFVSVGMCADWSLHDKGDGNPHAHIMLTTRPFKENGEWGAKEKKVYELDWNGERIPVLDPQTGEQKIGARGRKLWKRTIAERTGWSHPDMAEIWRKNWAKTCNRYLAGKVIPLSIDHRSYERQGKEQIPMIHEGAAARSMEQQGTPSERCEQNRKIRTMNQEIRTINQAIRTLFRSSQQAMEQIGTIPYDFGYGERQLLELDQKLTVCEQRILEKETEKEQVQKAHPDADDEAKETLPMLNLELEYLRKKRESLEQQYFFELDRNDEWKELEAKISAKKAPETGKYSPAFHDIRKEKERNPSERLHTKKDRGRSR